MHAHSRPSHYHSFMEKPKAPQSSATVAPKKLALLVLTLAATALTTHASAINTVGGTGGSTGLESISCKPGTIGGFGLE